MVLPLKVDSLVKAYGNIVAVNGISFEVKKGEVFGLIGVNGAGKSTTLRIVATLLKPTSGKVEVYGKDVVNEAEKVRDIISYLPEEAGTYKNMTGKEFLNFIASVKLPEKDREERVKWAMERSGLGERINSLTGTYSKGMKRRVLLVATLMGNPQLAILDEPTSGMDVLHALFLRKVIKDYVKETGNAVLLSSHNMLEVAYMCDRVAILHAGVIVETGRPDELISKYSVSNLEEVFREVVSKSKEAVSVVQRT